MIRAEDIVKTYGRPSRPWRASRSVHALSGVSLEVADGRTLGVVGESGSGKSTLARIVVGLERPDSGKVWLDDIDVFALARSEFRQTRRQFQMVFQDSYSSLNPMMSVMEVVREPLDIRKTLAPADRRARVHELLDLVRLDQTIANRRSQKLSGGQRQRVAIARSLAAAPSLIVLDEALASLDVSTQAQIMQLLRDIQSRTGVSYLFIGHDLAAVQQISDEIIVMYAGKVVERGPARALLSDPQHPYTVELKAAIPVVDPRVRRQAPARPGAGEPPDLRQTLRGCAFQRRCPHAFAQCLEVAPLLREVDSNRSVACHLVTNEGAVPIQLTDHPRPDVVPSIEAPRAGA